MVDAKEMSDEDKDKLIEELWERKNNLIKNQTFPMLEIKHVEYIENAFALDLWGIIKAVFNKEKVYRLKQIEKGEM